MPPPQGKEAYGKGVDYPSGGAVAGIGMIHGRLCVILANDATVKVCMMTRLASCHGYELKFLPYILIRLIELDIILHDLNIYPPSTLPLMSAWHRFHVCDLPNLIIQLFLT